MRHKPENPEPVIDRNGHDSLSCHALAVITRLRAFTIREPATEDAGGGTAIPTVPVKETIWPVAGDNTANIQAAIDKFRRCRLTGMDSRARVLLRAGYHRMATPVQIQASGVVLRGEGMGDTGTILIGTGTGRPQAAAPVPGAAPGGRGGAPGGGRGGFGGGQPTLIRIAGASGWAPKDDTRQLVTDDYVPVGSTKITIASARAYRPGDTVIVRRIGNQDWIDAMGMNGKEYPQDNWRAPFNVDWDRVVTEVQGDTITIDAPITCAIEKKWAGAK